MEKALNSFLYCIYLMDVKLHYLSNYINPAWLLLYVPFIKKKWERKNQDPVKELNKLFTDKVHGFSIWTAQGIVGIVISSILISSIIVTSRVFDFNFYGNISRVYFFGCAGIAIVVCYSYSWKNDKYLDYFEQFKKWSKSQKRKYIIISFLVVLASIGYFLMSFMCC